MTFLSPWLLAALPAVGIPVIIHLLNRGKPRPIRWAAMQFLLDSVRKNQRRLQLRDLILLILRALVILFLVLLFAKPAIWVAAGDSGAIPSPVAGMIVMDVSASMAQSDGRRSRLEIARTEALKTLDEMNADSSCGLILATDRAIPVVPRPSSNLELVRESLNSVTGTSSATDLLPAIDRAFQELSRTPSAKKLILLYTDSQESAWRERAAIEDLSAKYPDIDLRSVPIGEKGEPNTAITGMTIQPAHPTTGESANVRIDVTNQTGSSQDGIRVTLAANQDKPQDEATLPAIPAGETASANLKITFDQVGLQTLRAEIPQDLFPTDNTRSLAVSVGLTRNFLIINESDAGDPRNSPVFFLRIALEASAKGATVQVRPSSQVSEEVLEKASAVFVSSPGALSDAQWGKLEKYVQAGGGIVVFPDEGSSATLGSSPATRWLPGALGKRLPQSSTWVQAGLSHPVTAAWADANRTRLTNISADARFEITSPASSAKLAKYTDGVAVAVSSEVGSGRAVLFGSSPVPAATKLVIHPFFPILIGGLVDYLAIAQSLTPSLRPGGAFSASVPAALIGKNIFLATDRSAEKMAAGVVVAAESEGKIQLSAVEQPAGYRVFVDGNEEALAAFSVALDPTESILKSAEPVQITAGKSPAGTSSATRALAVKVPQSIWTFFAISLLILCFVELALAHRFTITR
jgi:Aerotolerance regulator N-terminal/von Willebrand factor type A domain